MDFIYYQLKSLMTALASPQGMAVVGFALLFALAVLISRAWQWIAVIAILYISGLGRPNNVQSYVGTLVPPLNVLDSLSRLLISSICVLLLVPALRGGKGARSKTVLGATLFFLVFQLCLALRDLGGGAIDRGLSGIANVTLIFLVMGIGISHWMQNDWDAHTAARCIGIMGFLFVLGTMAQLAFSRSTALLNHRLCATAPNSNFAGEVIGTAMPAVVYVMMRKDERKGLRITAAVITGFLVLFMVWTGSRNCLLMSLVGVGYIFRRRLGSFLMASAVVSLFVLVGLQLYGNSGISMDRLLSMENTRAGPWMSLTMEFLSSPFWGRGMDTNFTENSYLLAAARCGLIASVPLAISTCLMIRTLVVMRRLGPFVEGGNALLLDCAVGGVLSILVGALGDGYLLGNFEAPVFALFVYLAILTYLGDVKGPHNSFEWNEHAYAEYEVEPIAEAVPPFQF